jgi:hypothetical protein
MSITKKKTLQSKQFVLLRYFSFPLFPFLIQESAYLKKQIKKGSVILFDTLLILYH